LYVQIYSICLHCNFKASKWDITSYHAVRNEENKSILPFYRKHKDCAKKDINNVQSVMDNNGNDPEWMNSPSSGGYDYDSLIYELKVYEK
jgi:hypothetical protein